jgi:hypothetical protein
LEAFAEHLATRSGQGDGCCGADDAGFDDVDVSGLVAGQRAGGGFYAEGVCAGEESSIAGGGCCGGGGGAC